MAKVAKVTRKTPAMTALHIPSPWVARFAPLVGRDHGVLDVASGNGRHARLFLDRGHAVTALDIDLRGLDDVAHDPAMRLVKADLEGAPWPLAGQRFDAVVVANYLHRPLFDRLIGAVAPGGLLIYETFMAGNQAFGRPSSAAYLLEPGELLGLVAGRLSVVAFEQGEISSPRAAVVQRIAACHGAAPRSLPQSP